MNNSDNSFYVMEGIDSNADDLGTDPRNWGQALYNEEDKFYVARRSSNSEALRAACISEKTVSSKDPSKHINVFLFDSAVAYSHPCDSVKAKHLYLHRYILNYDSLNNREWKIVYP